MRPDILFVLAAECARVSDVLGALRDDDFTRPTRCPPWDVKQLGAHLWNALDRLRTSLAEPSPSEPTADAVTYWRSYDPVADASSVAARSVEVAARFADGAELAGSFDAQWRICVEAARGTDPGRLVRTRVADLRLDEFAATRVLEAAVHGLDLAEALGCDPWITPAAAEVTTVILCSLLGADRPSGWDDVAFIEIGTGRRAPGARETADLGAGASRLPLLA